MFFTNDDIQPSCTHDYTKEMIKGKFHQKLKDVECHLKQLEPYILWLNAAEWLINELKKGAG